MIDIIIKNELTPKMSFSKELNKVESFLKRNIKSFSEEDILLWLNHINNPLVRLSLPTFYNLLNESQITKEVVNKAIKVKHYLPVLLEKNPYSITFLNT